MILSVLQGQGYSLNVQNPCWPKNFNKSLTFGDVYESPCTASEKPPNYDPTKAFVMGGSADGEQCRTLVDNIFQFSNCPYTSCSFDKIFQPKVSGKFIVSDINQHHLVTFLEIPFSHY